MAGSLSCFSAAILSDIRSGSDSPSRRGLFFGCRDGLADFLQGGFVGGEQVREARAGFARADLAEVLEEPLQRGDVVGGAVLGLPMLRCAMDRKPWHN